jgi:hypothetical protein
MNDLRSIVFPQLGEVKSMQTKTTTRAREEKEGQYLKEQVLESHIFSWPRYVTIYPEVR